MPLPNVKRSCGADTEKGPCPNPAMDNGRCYKHGGATPVGAASVHFKHGKFSKYLPDRMIERYEEGRRDPELTSLADQLALIHERECQIMEGFDRGESDELWSALGNAVYALKGIEKEAEKAKNDPAKAESLNELKRAREQAIENICILVDQGLGEVAAWRGLFDLWERRRKLSQTQIRREQVLQQMVPLAEVLTMKAAVKEIMRTHVRDTDTLRAILADLGKLDRGHSNGTGPRPETGAGDVR